MQLSINRAHLEVVAGAKTSESLQRIQEPKCVCVCAFLLRTGFNRIKFERINGYDGYDINLNLKLANSVAVSAWESLPPLGQNIVDTFLQPLRTKLSNILREVGLQCFKAWTFGYSLVHTLLVTSTWNDQAASSCFGKAVKLSLMVLWLRQASSIIPIFWPSYLLASLNLLHSRADSCVCWQRCAETSQSSFQGNLCDSQYAIRTTGDSVLIWRRGLSCQGSCLWLVDDGRCQIEWELCTMKHGKTDWQTLPILSVACYSVLSLLPHSSTSLSRLFDGRTTLTPGLVQFLPAGHVGNLHIPRIEGLRVFHRKQRGMRSLPSPQNSGELLAKQCNFINK